MMHQRNGKVTSGNDKRTRNEDDGGSAKGNGRRLRRKLHKMRPAVALVAVVLLPLYLYSAGGGAAAPDEEARRERLRRHARELAERRREMSKHTDDPTREGAARGEGEGGGGGGGEHREEYFRWADATLLPPLPGNHRRDLPKASMRKVKEHRRRGGLRQSPDVFRVRHGRTVMDWETEADDEVTGDHVGPAVDYTKLKYEYPKRPNEPPPMGEYPPLEPLGNIMERWPQDDIDHPPQPYVENLLHFDYMDLEQRAVAEKFRNLELPFKMVNVPELDVANVKWTDEYVSSHFDSISPTKAHGTCQESVDSFFCFFRSQNWDVDSMGPPPTKDNDFTFAKWAKHARYADRVGLAPSETHYYWQAGVDKRERLMPKTLWSFISKDLPSFSSPKSTFFGFNPSEQKGIQCRFGERGVTAATHYDSGRNMVAMITGAKRYILGPPKACPKLGIIATKRHPAFRHSLLNFGHLNALKSEVGKRDMPLLERQWMDISYDSMAVDTVLKAGEVLYIPSHWFHYIISLQKSAQCNTRSGVHIKGSKAFGGDADVKRCVGE